MGNTPEQKFSKCCLRIGAAVITLPTVLAGVGVAIVGYFSAMGMWVPGLIAGLAVGIATKDAKAGAAAFNAVTYGIGVLGVAMLGAGIAAGVYAAQGDTAFEDEGVGDDPNPTSYVYR